VTATQRVDGKRPWAPVVGYSRAVRRGDVVEVSGTSATRQDGSVVSPGDAYGQTVEILRVITEALTELGATVDDVVRTRVYLTDIGLWQQVARAHGQVFSTVLPACTFVEISALMLPELVVEVEASAVVSRT
jgi:enamine deaminase RidA (YjgF/YER057c/UK114 family)